MPPISLWLRILFLQRIMTRRKNLFVLRWRIGMKKFRAAWISVFVILLLAFLQPSALAARVPSADENWSDEFYPPGPDKEVKTLAFNGNDLFVGGKFHSAGKTLATHIAWWNGT